MRTLTALAVLALTLTTNVFAQIDLAERLDIEFTNEMIASYNSAYSYFGLDCYRNGNTPSSDTAISATPAISDEPIVETVKTEIDTEFANWMANLEAKTSAYHQQRTARNAEIQKYSETEKALASSLGYSNPADAITYMGKKQFSRWVKELDENYAMIQARDHTPSTTPTTTQEDSPMIMAIDGEILE